MFVLGIDPGITGALAVVDHANGELVYVSDVPVEVAPSGKKRICAHELAIECVSIVEGLEEHVLLSGASEMPQKLLAVNVEYVHATPQMGVTSAFNFGETAGVIRGVLSALNMSVTYVNPVAWKREQNLLRTEKDAARLKVLDLYPQHHKRFDLKKHGGRADAVLIARHGFKLLH